MPASLDNWRFAAMAGEFTNVTVMEVGRLGAECSVKLRRHAFSSVARFAAAQIPPPRSAVAAALFVGLYAAVGHHTGTASRTISSRSSRDRIQSTSQGAADDAGGIRPGTLAMVGHRGGGPDVLAAN